MSWPSGKVSDIGEVISGFAFKSEWFGVGNAKVIRIGDLQDGRVDLAGAETFDESAHQVREQFKIRNGDILMALSGATVGKIAVADTSIEGAYLNQRVAVVRGKCPTNTEYLKYVFSGSLLQKLLINAGGAAQPNLSPKDLGDMQIPLPPLEEQKRIAAILDKADAIRRKRQQAIKLADDFLRSVFLEMFGDPVTNPKGWDKCCIGDVCEVQGGLQVSTKREGLPLLKPYLRVANVLRNKLDLSEIKFMNVTEAEASRIALKQNDILVVEGHGNKVEIGRCAIWNGDIEDVIHQNHLIRVRVKARLVTAQLVNDFINSSGGRSQMLRSSNTTSGLNTISTGIVKSTEMYLPPIDMQISYERICKKVSFLLSKVLSSKDASNENFLSLSKKAFSGVL